MHRAHDHQWSCPNTRACNSDRQRHLYWHVSFHDHLRSFHLLLILHSSEFCFVIIHIIPHWIMCSWLESILHHLDNSIPLLSILRHLRLVFSDLGFLCSPAQSTRLGNSLPRTETISLLVCVDNHVRLVLVKLLVVVVPLVVASWLEALCSVLLHVFLCVLPRTPTFSKFSFSEFSFLFWSITHAHCLVHLGNVSRRIRLLPLLASLSFRSVIQSTTPLRWSG